MDPERIILTLSITPKTPTARAVLRYWVETNTFPHDDICDLIASMLYDDARDAGFLRADFTVRSVGAVPPPATTSPEFGPREEARADARTLEPGAPVLVSSDVYEGVAIFEAVENDGSARVRVETTGAVLRVDVEHVTPCPGC